MGSYRKVDINHWERQQHYAIFKEYADPRYDISFELDITNFLKQVKEQGWSFTLAMIYKIAVSANQIEEFRYRFEEGEPVIYDEPRLSFTYLNQETKLFKNVVVDMKEEISEFNRLGRQDNASVFCGGASFLRGWNSYRNTGRSIAGRFK